MDEPVDVGACGQFCFCTRVGVLPSTVAVKKSSSSSFPSPLGFTCLQVYRATFQGLEGFDFTVQLLMVTCIGLLECQAIGVLLTFALLLRAIRKVLFAANNFHVFIPL
jgi:hypothetical protein